MTAPLSAERVIELRGRTECARTRGRGLLDRDYTDLLSILSDYSSMRAEVKNLEGQLIDYAWLNGELLESKKKAEAELARQAPLIEAVMGAERLRYVNLWKNLPTEQVFSNDGIRAILRAAHALREEK